MIGKVVIESLKNFFGNNKKSRRKRILLLDDELWLLQGLSQVLKLSYEVYEARNADQALRIVNSGINIDLIITDVMMPPGTIVEDANNGRTMGLSFLRYLQQSISHQYIPVIVYTVVSDKNIHLELLNAGATEIVSKAESIRVLTQIVAKYLEH